jgi:hypothetical protein
MGGYFRAVALPSLSRIGCERFLYLYRQGQLWDEACLWIFFQKIFGWVSSAIFAVFRGCFTKSGGFLVVNFVVSLWWIVW